MLQRATIVKVDPSFTEIEPRWRYDPNKLFEVRQITPDGVDLLPEFGLVVVRVPARYLIVWDVDVTGDTEPLDLIFDTLAGDDD